MKFYPFCLHCGRLITKTDSYIPKGYCDPWCWDATIREYDSFFDIEPYKEYNE